MRGDLAAFLRRGRVQRMQRVKLRRQPVEHPQLAAPRAPARGRRSPARDTDKSSAVRRRGDSRSSIISRCRNVVPLRGRPVMNIGRAIVSRRIAGSRSSPRAAAAGCPGTAPCPNAWPPADQAEFRLGDAGSRRSPAAPERRRRNRRCRPGGGRRVDHLRQPKGHARKRISSRARHRVPPPEAKSGSIVTCRLLST